MTSTKSGMTLVELVIAMGLAMIVVLGLTNLAAPLARAQVQSHRAQTAQMTAATLLSWSDRSIREAAYVRSPPAAGGPSSRLEGCVNGVPGEDGAASARIDPALPVRWFALCPREERLFVHQGEGCPPAFPPYYRCGEEAAASFAASAAFTRASAASTVIDLEVEARSGEAVSNLRSSVGFSAAAGANQ